MKVSLFYVQQNKVKNADEFEKHYLKKIKKNMSLQIISIPTKKNFRSKQEQIKNEVMAGEFNLSGSNHGNTNSNSNSNTNTTLPYYHLDDIILSTITPQVCSGGTAMGTAVLASASRLSWCTSTKVVQLKSCICFVRVAYAVQYCKNFAALRAAQTTIKCTHV